MVRNYISVPLAYGKIEDLVYSTTAKIADQYKLHRHTVWNPHITLFGSFTLNRGCSYSEVYKAIEENAKKFDSLSYSIEGWKIMHSKNLGCVVAHQVKLNNDFEDLYQSLTGDLLKFVYTPRWPDYMQESKYLHISVLQKMYDREEAYKIYRHLENQSFIEPIHADLNAPRIYFGHGAYDIPRKNG